MSKKLLLVAVSLMLTVGLAAGLSASPDKPNRNSDSFSDVTGVENRTGFLPDLRLFSFVQGPDTVRPGETAEIDIEVDIQETFSTLGKSRVVEVYRCHDSGCDDPERDEFIAKDSYTIPFDYTQKAGSTWGWTFDYRFPEQEGHYGVVAYISDPGVGLLSDDPVKVFEVKEREVDEPPTANIDGPKSLEAGSRGTWSASSSSDDNGISSIVWRVDGNRAGTGPSLSNSFEEEGRHTVRVTVTDTAGQTDSARRQVSVALPDRDGDGVRDSMDDCPGTPSGVSVDDSGCAVDSDGDGVPDYQDDCPRTGAGDAGLGSDGCPLNDADNDGVINSSDSCPDVYGSKSDGCPNLIDRILNVLLGR